MPITMTSMRHSLDAGRMKERDWNEAQRLNDLNHLNRSSEAKEV